jgi:hypothetical protein
MSKTTAEYWVFVDFCWTRVDSSLIIPCDADPSSCPPYPSSGSKPPLGLKPKKLWEEKRAADLCEAIERYLNVGHDVPYEWVEELLTVVKNRRAANETGKV